MSAISLPIGSAQPQELLHGGKVKGGVVAAHLKWVTDTHSSAEFGAFWSALPREVRAGVDGLVLPVKWYDFAHLIEIDRVIVAIFGRGNAAMLRELGAHSARLNLSSVYRSARRPSVHEFLEGSARLHGQFQDFGQARYEQSGTYSGKMIHTGYRSYSPLYCQSAIGYYVEAVTLHGGRSTHVIETSCQCRGDEACTFTIRWR